MDVRLQNLINNRISALAKAPEAASKAALELALRSVDKEMFESLATALEASNRFGGPALQFAIDTVSTNLFSRHDRTEFIRRQTFDAGVKTSDQLLKRRMLEPPVVVKQFIDYTINMPVETESRPFATKQDAQVLFKVSAVYSTDNWDVKLSAIKKSAIRSVGPVMKAVVQEMFAGTVTSSFLETVAFNLVTQFNIDIVYTGDRATLTAEIINEVTADVFAMINPEYAAESIFRSEVAAVAAVIIKNPRLIQQFRRNGSLKRLVNQAWALSRQSYASVFPPIGYYVTEKADGQRAVASIVGSRCRILSGRLDEYMGASGAALAPTTGLSADMTITDGELLADGRLLVFDVMVCEGQLLVDEPFSVRVTYLVEACEHINRVIAAATNSRNTDRPKTTASPKLFFRLNDENIKERITAVYGQSYTYEIDGIMITPPDQTYALTQTLKWKPTKDNTIDFLMIRMPNHLIGRGRAVRKPGYELYFMFVGISADMMAKLNLTFIEQYRSLFPTRSDVYFPVQFSPSADPYAYMFWYSGNENLHNKIVEMRKQVFLDEATQRHLIGDWEVVRVRDDRRLETRDYGNNFMTAETIFMNYVNPITLEDLWSPITSYFTKDADNSYKAPNGFKRFAITQEITGQLANADLIIDFAAGRGADINRYQMAGVKRGLFIDIDLDALNELVSRKFSLLTNKRKQHLLANKNTLNIMTMHADLLQPAATTIDAIGTNYDIVEGQAAGGVCNFAIHYMCGNLTKVRNFVKLVAAMLAIGAPFIFTTLSARRVFDLLAANKIAPGDEWRATEGTTVKYAIRRKYTTNRLAKTNQMISVKMPFNDDYIDEPMANIDMLITEFIAAGFEFVKNISFAEYAALFAAKNKVLAAAMHPIDFDYAALHSMVVLKRVR